MAAVGCDLSANSAFTWDMPAQTFPRLEAAKEYWSRLRAVGIPVGCFREVFVEERALRNRFVIAPYDVVFDKISSRVGACEIHECIIGPCKGFLDIDIPITDDAAPQTAVLEAASLLMDATHTALLYNMSISLGLPPIVISGGVMEFGDFNVFLVEGANDGISANNAIDKACVKYSYHVVIWPPHCLYASAREIAEYLRITEVSCERRRATSIDFNVYSTAQLRMLGCAKVSATGHVLRPLYPIGNRKVSRRDMQSAAICYTTDITPIIMRAPMTAPTPGRTNNTGQPSFGYALLALVREKIPHATATTYYPESQKVRVNSSSKMCCFIGREHKSNHVYYMLDLAKERIYMGCMDTECGRGLKDITDSVSLAHEWVAHIRQTTVPFNN